VVDDDVEDDRAEATKAQCHRLKRPSGPRRRSRSGSRPRAPIAFGGHEGCASASMMEDVLAPT
jgi:hypothetical protein